MIRIKKTAILSVLLPPFFSATPDQGLKIKIAFYVEIYTT